MGTSLAGRCDIGAVFWGAVPAYPAADGDADGDAPLEGGRVAMTPFRYWPVVLSSTQVSTLSEPSWMIGYFGGGKSSSRWSYV
jgi:hypothetical protein